MIDKLPFFTNGIVKEMAEQCTFEDSIASTIAWEAKKSDWLDSLKTAKQPAPTAEQLASVREIWLEGFLSGRLSK